MEVYINSTLTTGIRWDDFEIQDNIDNHLNTCYFTIANPSSTPSLFSEIEVYHNSEKIFAGEILRTKQLREDLLTVLEVECVDYTHKLGRSITVERFDDKTVDFIISFLINKYHVDFINQSDCNITVKTFTCNNISVLEAIERLAEATNYRWYVDYNKNLKFFAVGTETAPFNLEEGEYIYNSLVINNDGSQLRNAVKIRGGEMVGEERTETFDGDDEKTIFALANKYATLPKIELYIVDTWVEQDAGVDFLDTDKDVYWNFNEKYVRFETAPGTASNNIRITGDPLIPIVVRKYDSTSINQYGVHEFFKRDASLKSKEEVLQYAVAQLEAYKNEIVEGTFKCHQQCASGQTITYGSDDYMIQGVKMRMITPFDIEYFVEMASTKTLKIIDFLQGLINTDRRIILGEQDDEPLLTFADMEDSFSVDDTLEGSGTWDITSAPYTWEDTTGDVEVNPIRWNLWIWEDEL
jgi:hypothetical protein